MADRSNKTSAQGGPMRGRRLLLPTISLTGLVLAALLLAACNPQAMAQATEATQTAAVNTPAPASTAPVATAAATDTTTTTTTTEADTPAPEGTGTPLPTPAGPTPADPTDLLNAFAFFPGNNTLVKRDALNLEGDSTPEMLYTVSAPAEAVTKETTSVLAIINYDPKYRQWQVEWQGPPVDGTAEPLPATNTTFGYNGGDILHTGSPILVLRTTTHDQRAHLYLFRWDSTKHQATALKMAGAKGDVDARLDGDLDVNMADLDGDGIYEVIADNLKSVQTWKWDGSRFVQAGGR